MANQLEMTDAVKTVKKNHHRPKKTVMDVRGQVVEHGVDGAHNGLVRMANGKEAAAERKEKNRERKAARKQRQAEQPRFRGSLAKRMEQQDKENKKKKSKATKKVKEGNVSRKKQHSAHNHVVHI